MKDAIGQVDCSERARRRIERFDHMISAEFPWLWAISPLWDTSDMSTMPKVRRFGKPELEEHLRADSSLFWPQTWLVIKQRTSVHVMRIGGKREESWLKAINRTLCATYGCVGNAQIIYVAVVQCRAIGGIDKRVTIYRCPMGGWKWGVGEPLRF